MGDGKEEEVERHERATRIVPIGLLGTSKLTVGMVLIGPD